MSTRSPSRQPPGPTGFDDIVADRLGRWSQALSRRGLMVRVGHVALSAFGLSLVSVLPAYRIAPQFTCSGDWQTCNMHGNWCKACCEHGARYNQCPSCPGTTQGSWWEGCCFNPNTCENVTIRYYDCCNSNTAVINACKGDLCGLDPNGPGYPCPNDWAAYCPGGGAQFVCTIVVNTGVSCATPHTHC